MTTFGGAKLFWLESDGKTFRANETTPEGAYTIIAMFHGEASAMQAGKVTISADKMSSLQMHQELQDLQS